jgi:hypothetical protein
MEGEALIIRLRAVFQDSIYPIAVDLAVSNGRVKRETSMTEDREGASSGWISGPWSGFHADLAFCTAQKAFFRAAFAHIL